MGWKGYGSEEHSWEDVSDVLPASHACFIDGIQRRPGLSLQGGEDKVRVSLDLENEEAYQPEVIQLEELQAETAVLHSNQERQLSLASEEVEPTPPPPTHPHAKACWEERRAEQSTQSCPVKGTNPGHASTI